LMHRAYHYRLARKRVGPMEAMMEQHTEWRQLDLLALSTSAMQQLDPMIRAEIVGLLKLIIIECGATASKARETHDE
jgi:hypothetical protein